MRVLYFVAIWFYVFSILVAQLFLFFSALRLPFVFSVVKSILCGSFSADTMTSSNEELLLSEVSQ